MSVRGLADPWAPHSGLPFALDHGAALLGSLWWPDPASAPDHDLLRAQVVADLCVGSVHPGLVLESHVRAAVVTPDPPVAPGVPDVVGALAMWPALSAPAVYPVADRCCTGLALTRMLTVLRAVVEPRGPGPLACAAFPSTPLLVVPGGNLYRLLALAWSLVVSGLRAVHAFQLAPAETLPTPATALRTIRALWIAGACPPIVLGALTPADVARGAPGALRERSDPWLGRWRERTLRRYAQASARLHGLAVEGRAVQVLPISPYVSGGRLKPPTRRLAHAASLSLHLLDHVVRGLRLLGALIFDLTDALAVSPDVVFGTPQDYRVPPLVATPPVSPPLSVSPAIEALAALDPVTATALLDRLPGQLHVPHAALLLGERAVARAFVRWAPVMTPLVWGGSRNADHPDRAGAHLPGPADVLWPRPDLGVAPPSALLRDRLCALPRFVRAEPLGDVDRRALAGFVDG